MEKALENIVWRLKQVYHTFSLLKIEEKVYLFKSAHFIDKKQGRVLAAYLHYTLDRRSASVINYTRTGSNISLPTQN